MQDHVHIALTLGGSPEFSPVHKWKATSYGEEPMIILNSKRTSNGKLRFHTVHNASGPIQFMNFEMTLKCLDDNTYTARQYLEFLKAMNGNFVQFVDFDHPDDGDDHTAYVKSMGFQIVKVRPLTTMLNYYQVDVKLDDNFTVP